MRSYLLRCELKTTTPLADVFRVFENPYNLAVITPPWLNFQILDKGLEMRQGLEINYRIRWMGLPMRWQTIITDYQPPFRFVDFQSKGPYVLWHHTHLFQPTNDGVVVADQVRYVLPLGPLGMLAHAIIVKRQLLEIFRYRQRKIGEMLGGVVESYPPTIEVASAVTKQQLADYRAYASH
jgi:ligand-binding SRPBCC domain-containing protein